MAANLRGRRGARDENLNPNLRDVNVTVNCQGLDYDPYDPKAQQGRHQGRFQVQGPHHH